MQKIYFVVIIQLFIMSGCYKQEDQFSSLKTVNLSLSAADAIYADSATVQNVYVNLPGLKFNGNKLVTLKTDWGNWSNDSTIISIQANFDTVNNYYTAKEYLKPGRTVEPFYIAVHSGDENSTFYFQSIRRSPSLIHIVADSSVIKNQLGAASRVTAHFFSEKGFPSYGFKFGFHVKDSATIVPLQLIYDNSKILSSNLRISTETQEDTLIISGRILDFNSDATVVPAKIILNK